MKSTVITKRRFIAGALALGALAAADSFLFEPRRVVVRRQVVAIKDLPGPFEGFRICQLTDLHHGKYTGIDFIRESLDKVRALMPDLIALTGDYIDRYPFYLEAVIRELGGLEAEYGVYAVLGNHDHVTGGKAVARMLNRFDIPVIDNGRRFIEKDGAAFCLAGVGDLMEDRQDLEGALKGVPPEMPRVLLSHHPDFAEEIPGNKRVDLVLSGHTHGGQVRLFSFVPYTSSRYGQKYAGGLVRLKGTQVYVSAGLGVSLVPLRFNCPPEITVIELSRAA